MIGPLTTEFDKEVYLRPTRIMMLRQHAVSGTVVYFSQKHFIRVQESLDEIREAMEMTKQ